MASLKIKNLKDVHAEDTDGLVQKSTVPDDVPSVRCWALIFDLHQKLKEGFGFCVVVRTRQCECSYCEERRAISAIRPAATRAATRRLDDFCFGDMDPQFRQRSGTGCTCELRRQLNSQCCLSVNAPAEQNIMEILLGKVASCWWY